jgi:signal transduction histidine kinase
MDCSAEIFADPDQIKQVLIYLAKNSLEAMESSTNPKTLTFSISKDVKTQTLLISLTDTGCGIPCEMLDKVTTSFFTTKKFGTGLGLNISQTIIEQHGGFFEFVSSQEGTTATIHLPLFSDESVECI